jgi:hypothetical protein
MTSGTLLPRIDIFSTNIPTSALRNVIVLANFDVVSQTVNTNFPFAGNWVDLMLQPLPWLLVLSEFLEINKPLYL